MAIPEKPCIAGSLIFIPGFNHRFDKPINVFLCFPETIFWPVAICFVLLPGG